MNEIAENIFHIREKMAIAITKARRRPNEVKLLAVSKTVNHERVAMAIAAGADIIGENYIQEALEKEAMLSTARNVHFIGHLQTNKAKYAVRLFDMIHSVDRMELARELDKRARALDKAQDVLLEINVGDEASKSGVAPSDAGALLEQVAQCENLRVRGLMGMPPPGLDADQTRRHFTSLRETLESLRSLKISRAPLDELSMGMSDDYELAIAEGATIVRIGKGIFGERPQKTEP